jgi:hypothetical protein
VKLRALAVTTALALAATGLSACSSKVGLAAEVGSHHLTINDVGKQVKRGTLPYADSQTGATVYPTSFAVEAWIQDQLFGLALSQRTGKKTPAAADVHVIDAALDSAIGSDAHTYFRTTYGKLGYTTQFADLLVHQQEEVLLLAHSYEPKVSASQLLSDLQSSQTLNDDILKSLTAVKASVSVAGRYGAWNAKTLSLSTTGSAGRPNFVTIGPDTQPGAASTAAP